MKKLLVRALAGAGALLLLAIAAVYVQFYVRAPRQRPAPVMSAPTDAAAIARGRYLANNVAACMACHSKVDSTVAGEPPLEGMLGAGRDFGEYPGYPVHVRGPNLTPDRETGLGDWTDGEIARATREGVSRDGRPLFPEMPYRTYRQTLSDGEVLDIIAYLRSLPPVKNPVGSTSVEFPASMFLRTAPRPLQVSPPPAPAPSDPLERGKWILGTASCHDCHDAVSDKGEKIEGKELAGGMKFPLAGGKGVLIAPNITSDKATGIGAYSDDELRRVFDEGKGKDGRTLAVMPWWYFRGMSREDKDALMAALRDVPAVPNLVASE